MKYYTNKKLIIFYYFSDNQYLSHTPEKVLRERIKYLKQEFDELREFTTLEKQMYIENHQCYVAVSTIASKKFISFFSL